jgi:cellulose 1,4-beta-cellobiosidase
MILSQKQPKWRSKSRVSVVSFLLMAALCYLSVRVHAQSATTHSVTLNWIASITPNVTYTVYRATVSAGPFTAIATGVATTTFTDTTGVGGTQYYYEVDAVSSGGSSGPSNEVNATFLVNPAPPTGLGAVSN